MRAAIIPQPMSTPTAAGITAPAVATTLPTVAPMPWCASGMTATHLWTKGRLAMFLSCFSAPSSSGTPTVHALMGTPESVAMILYVVSMMAGLVTRAVPA